jgi:hypothetical protein
VLDNLKVEDWGRIQSGWLRLGFSDGGCGCLRSPGGRADRVGLSSRLDGSGRPAAPPATPLLAAATGEEALPAAKTGDSGGSWPGGKKPSVRSATSSAPRDSCSPPQGTRNAVMTRMSMHGFRHGHGTRYSPRVS